MKKKKFEKGSNVLFYPDINKLINKIIQGDCLELLKKLPANSIDLIITSPPYFKQREYGNIGIGNETTVEEYVENLFAVFTEAVRVIKETGSIVINIGDKWINGSLLLVPYRFALRALEIKGVKLINEITWVKINPTPKQDKTKLVSSKEPFFVFAKSSNYFFDKDSFLAHRDSYKSKKKNGIGIGKKYFELIKKSNLTDKEKSKAERDLHDIINEVKDGKIESFRMKIRDIHKLPYGGQEGGRKNHIKNDGYTLIRIHGNAIRRDVIESTVETIKGNIHPAIYPEYIIYELLKLLTPTGAIVLDPFMGSGTTAIAAKYLNRRYIGFEIFQEYVDYANQRLSKSGSYNLELFA